MRCPSLAFSCRPVYTRRLRKQGDGLGVGVSWLRGLMSADLSSRQPVRDALTPRRALAYQILLTLVIVVATAIAVVDTVPGDPWGESRRAVRLVTWACIVVLGGDYLLRLALAGRGGTAALAGYVVSPYGVFDFLAVVPFVAGAVAGLHPDVETVFGVLRFLKLARYSPALETLGAVVLAELRPLGSALFIMVLLVLASSASLYFVERDVNPGMVSIPHAMWWSVVTLATLGYGDVIPITVFGKMLGTVVALLGLGMFALPASILASGFTEEMRRQNFVATWHLVARVPFFARCQADQIAEIAGLLRVYRAVRGEVLMRQGDDGDCMYFIVAGQVEVLGDSGSFVLKAGDFFGEIALIERRPRTATVRAVTRCQLLVLSAADFHKFIAHTPGLMAEMRAVARSRLGGGDLPSHQSPGPDDRS